MVKIRDFYADVTAKYPEYASPPILKPGGMPEGGNVTPEPCVFRAPAGALSAVPSRSIRWPLLSWAGTSFLVISSMKKRPGENGHSARDRLCAAAWSCGEEHRDEEASGGRIGRSLSLQSRNRKEAPPIIFSQVIDRRKVFIEVRERDAVGGSPERSSRAPGRIVLDEGIVLNITAADFWGDAPGAFTFRARDRIEIARGFPAIRNAFPTFGAFIVVDGVDTVTAIFVDSPGERGVKGPLRVNGSQSTFFREAAFAGLFGVDEDIRRQKASLAFIIMDLLVEQIFFTAQTVATIREHEQSLADEGHGIFLR